MKSLYHLTVNTGNVRQSPRHEVHQQTIDRLLPVIDNEYGEFPELGLAVDIFRPLNEATRKPENGGMIFHIQSAKDQTLYAIAFGCWKKDMSDPAWAAACEQARVAGLAALMDDEPPRVPWLAVLLTAHIPELDPDRLLMLGGMERCLFWTAVEASK